MRRRDFALLTAYSVLAFPCPLSAQQASMARRIGVLVSYGLKQPNPASGLVRGLKELGYVEGRDIVLEWRSAQGNAAKYPALAAELVRAKVDLIVAGTNPAIHAARSATRTIPIVMTIAADPVATGFVANLSRPGGNITGVSIQSDDIASKRIQILKEAFPKLGRLAIVWASGEATRSESAKVIERAARELGLQVHSFPVKDPGELEDAFKAMRKHRAEAAVLVGSTMFYAQRATLARLTVQHRIPTLGSTRAYAEAGIPFSYGANFEDAYRRAAFYVDKILKGANPGELPVEQPTKFELLINVNTMGRLGMKISETVLARADEIVR